MKSNDVFVSVIMPTYNTEEKYLRLAIESILSQTHRNFEFLITVDGSINDDLLVVNEYAKIDPRICIVDNVVNRGLVYSLNNMLSLAKGKYIFRMDSDDISYTKRLETVINYLEKNDEVDICGSQVKYLFGNKSSRRTFLPCSDGEIKSWMVFSNPLAHPSVVFRGDSIKNRNIVYSDKEKSEDYNMWVCCAEQRMKYANVNKPLLLYRIHSKQTTTVHKEALSQSGLRIRARYLSYLGADLGEKDVELISSFSQNPVSLSNGDLVCISDIMLKLGDLFEDKDKTLHLYSILFAKGLITRCRRRSPKIGRMYKDMKILRYGSWYIKLLAKICSQI